MEEGSTTAGDCSIEGKVRLHLTLLLSDPEVEAGNDNLRQHRRIFYQGAAISDERGYEGVYDYWGGPERKHAKQKEKSEKEQKRKRNKNKPHHKAHVYTKKGRHKLKSMGKVMDCLSDAVGSAQSTPSTLKLSTKLKGQWFISSSENSPSSCANSEQRPADLVTSTLKLDLREFGNKWERAIPTQGGNFSGSQCSESEENCLSEKSSGMDGVLSECLEKGKELEKVGKEKSESLSESIFTKDLFQYWNIKPVDALVYFVPEVVTHSAGAEAHPHQSEAHPHQIEGIPWQWLREEWWRLHTFCKYPQGAAKSAILLAADGFAYIGSGQHQDDSVICCFCQVHHRSWQLTDDIHSVHASLNKFCSIVTGENCENVPMKSPSQKGNFFLKEGPSMSGVAKGPPSGDIESDAATPTAHGASRTAVKRPIPSSQEPASVNKIKQRNRSMEQVTAFQVSNSEASAATITSNTGGVNMASYGVPNHTTSPSGPPTNQGSDRERDSNRSTISNPEVPNQGPTPPPASRPTPPPPTNAPTLPLARTPAITPANTSAPPPTNTPASRESNPPTPPPTSGAPMPPVQEPNSQTPEQTPRPNTQPEEGSGNTYARLGIITDRPKRFEYAVKVARLRSFEGWPANHHLTKEALADAGFYFAGYGDCARCFYCGGGLRNWETNDDVWVEHARWFPKCAFLKQTVGHAFIETVQKLNRNQEFISYQDVLDNMGPQAMFLNSKENVLKNDAAVIAVTNLGYGLEDALKEAETMKTEGHQLSADKLFERLFKNQPLAQVAGIAEDSQSLSNGNSIQKDLETISDIKEQNNQLRAQTVCKICMDVEVSVVFLPCGHFVSCSECASALPDCPVCRQNVKGIVRAFIS